MEDKLLSEEDMTGIAAVSKYPLSEIKDVIKETEAHIYSKLTKDLPDVREIIKEIARAGKGWDSWGKQTQGRFLEHWAYQLLPHLLAAEQKGREEVIESIRKIELPHQYITENWIHDIEPLAAETCRHEILRQLSLGGKA